VLSIFCRFCFGIERCASPSHLLYTMFMESSRYDFRAIEVVLANKLISIFSRCVVRKHNVHVNFFFVNNPVVVYTILAHRSFHFCKVRLVDSAPATHSMFRSMLDFWFTQGAEIEFRDSPLTSEECPPLSMSIINEADPEKIGKAASPLPVSCKFIVYHKCDTKAQASDIWSFMHPLWGVGNILEYEEIHVSGDTYFVLVCEKRG
jgi:hypothetical protein